MPDSAPVRRWRLLLLFAGAALAACDGSHGSENIGTARWNGLDVSVESRPSPPRAGNNEVVVMVTGERHRPVFDAIVELRARSDADWVQAIEDGHVGVYRRAVNFGDANRAVLEVRLRRGGDEGTLSFPLGVIAVR
jgi:hypothetical protein